jgi:hypothetical protein
MDGDRLIKDLYDQFSGNNAWDRSAKTEMRTGMVEILKDAGFFVAEGKAELKELALEETDLVEPTE